jgi:HK97 family phage portal protein
MNRWERVKAATSLLLGSAQVFGNSFNRALYSFFTGLWYTLPDNKETYIREGYQKNADVYSVVSLISRKASLSPYRLYKVKDKKAFTEYQIYTKANNHYEANKFRSTALELVEGHPLMKLLNRPNDEQGMQQFMESQYGFLLLTGDSYIYGFGPGDDSPNYGKFTSLYTLPSQYTHIVGGGWTKPILGYKMMIGNQQVPFTAKEILHIKYFNPEYGIAGEQLYGQSPLKALLNTINSSNSADKARTKAFQNGGVAGLLSSRHEHIPLDNTQMSDIQEKIDTKIKGVENFMNIVATNGAVDYKQIGMSPVDLQVLESLAVDRERICNAYGVDPIIFSTDSATYNNKREAFRSLIMNVIVPLLNLYRDEFNRRLTESYDLKSEQYYIDYDLSVYPELKDDLKTQVEALDKAWWYTPNKKLEEMGQPTNPDPLMDKVYIPTNLQPIDSSMISDDTFEVDDTKGN